MKRACGALEAVELASRISEGASGFELPASRARTFPELLKGEAGRTVVRVCGRMSHRHTRCPYPVGSHRSHRASFFFPVTVLPSVDFDLLSLGFGGVYEG
jgi:hypothetical protein